MALINRKTLFAFSNIASNFDYGDFCENSDVVNFVTQKLNDEIAIDEKSSDEAINEYSDRYNDMMCNLYDYALNIDEVEIEIKI